MLEINKTLYAIVDSNDPNRILGGPEGDFISNSKKILEDDIKIWKLTDYSIHEIEINILQRIEETSDDMLRKLRTNEVVDALEWLTENPNQYCFASNYFSDKDLIISFVNNLYDFMDVERVEIDNIYGENWRIKSEGGPYADTLLIYTKPGADLTEIIECIMEYHPDEYSRDGNVIRLWWD